MVLSQWVLIACVLVLPPSRLAAPLVADDTVYSSQPTSEREGVRLANCGCRTRAG